MALNISQTHAKIGIDTTPARFSIESHGATLKIQQKYAQLDIQSTLPKVEIDQYEAFASAGLKNSLDLAKSENEKGKQRTLEYIGKLVSDGDALAAIENGSNAVAEIALSDSFKPNNYNIDFLPKARPDISLIEGEMNINPEEVDFKGVQDAVEFSCTPAQLKLYYTPAQVEVFLAQYASIKCSYSSDKGIDVYI